MKTFFKVGGIAVILFLIIATAPVFAITYDVVLARGDMPVDLLVAQAYTTKANLPLVTVTKAGISEELSTELSGYKEQGYKTLLIIGGEAAIPTSIEAEVKNIGYEVTRIWDWNRYGTAARVAINLWEKSEVVVVTQGDQKGQLMLAARTAIEYESPLLLTETDNLPDETKTAISSLAASRIILIGEVSENVKNDLSDLGGLQQTRVSPIEQEKTSKVSLFVIGLLVGGLFIFLASSLWGAMVLRKGQEVPYDIFNEDERRILDLIEERKGSIKQQELPGLSGFSRPKVSRIVADLVERGIIEKHKTKKTFVVKLIKNLKKGL